jgi:hypothetical protein
VIGSKGTSKVLATIVESAIVFMVVFLCFPTRNSYLFPPRTYVISRFARE